MSVITLSVYTLRLRATDETFQNVPVKQSVEQREEVVGILMTFECLKNIMVPVSMYRRNLLAVEPPLIEIRQVRNADDSRAILTMELAMSVPLACSLSARQLVHKGRAILAMVSVLLVHEREEVTFDSHTAETGVQNVVVDVVKLGPVHLPAATDATRIPHVR